MLGNNSSLLSEFQERICMWVKKGKVRPRTGYEGPEGEKRHSSTLSHAPAALPPGERDPVPIV
jgi:hypothetical protein